MGREQASFEGFVVARSPTLLRYAYVLCGDSALAEDLLQEGLLKAHRHWNRISALDGPDPYVKRIIANHFVSSRRRRSASEQVSDSIEFAAGSENSDEVVDREVLWVALRKLPPRQRAVLVLRFYEDRSDDEIGATFGCPSGTVRSLRARAFAAMHVHLDRVENSIG